MIDDNATMTGITLTMNGSLSPITKFDDGQYPTVTLAAGTFAPDYKTPTGTSGKASFTSLTIDSGVTFEPDGDLVDDDRLKVFSFTAITISSSEINFGLSTAEFTATSGGFYIPTYGATGYVSDFQAYYRKIVLKANTAGHKVLMDDNTFVSVEEFEIDDGVVLKGPVTDDAQGAEIRSTTPPKIRGTWSFSQVSQGLYRSPRHAAGVMAKVNGDFHITGKLTVDGLIDPTGMEFSQQSSNPGGVAANTIWINSADGHLYRGSVDVEAGGGGGGAVDSVFGRTGVVVATEGDYDLDLLGDVDVTSAVETQILRHDGTSFVNDYNDIMFLRVKAREAINKGEAIYIFDAHNSNVVGVKKARADSASTMPCIGVAYETLALGDEGLAVSFGKANGIAANFTEGETMYVSPTTAGALTNTKPTGNTQLIQNVGILMQAHASNAVVKVTGIGRSNDVPNQFSVGGSITAGSFVKSGGASTEFLKADGSVDTNTYLTSFTEADPIFTASPAASIINAGSGDVSQGDTAFGWGDHAAAGYLTSSPPETDPVFSAHPASGITVAGGGDVSKGETAFGWGDHGAAGYLTSFTEADPVFTASEANLFVTGDKAKLDGIEAGADVTDTANVTAAGALMDSEVTNLADVKSFDPADYRAATSEVCRVRLATSIASFTPTGAYTLLQNPAWDDPANINFDPITGLYTAPSTGTYRISWTISFRYTASGQTQASRLYVNGAWAAQGQAVTTGNWPVFGNSLLLDLAANDTVALYVYISATGKSLVGDSLSKAATQMSIEKVSN